MAHTNAHKRTRHDDTVRCAGRQFPIGRIVCCVRAAQARPSCATCAPAPQHNASQFDLIGKWVRVAPNRTRTTVAWAQSGTHTCRPPLHPHSPPTAARASIELSSLGVHLLVLCMRWCTHNSQIVGPAKQTEGERTQLSGTKIAIKM